MGGCDNVKKIHWIAWDSMVRPKYLGGLGIGYLSDMNVALLTKWLWRLKTQEQSLWSSCIASIHKIHNIDGKSFALKSFPGTWLSITEAEKDLSYWNISFNSCFTRKIGRGDKTHFWKDIWIDNVALKDVFPKLYLIEPNKNCFLADRSFNSQGNRWC